MPFPMRPPLYAAALLLFGAGVLAQPAPPGAGPSAGAQPPSPPTGVAPPPPGPRPDADAAAAQTASGRLQQWLVNPNGVVDGLLLAVGTQVALAPHWSARAVALFKAGDTVRATGWRAAGAPVLRATSLSNAVGHRLDAPTQGAEGPRPPPRDPAALTAMSASGKVARVLYTGRGDVNGVLLEGGSVVRFPPHVGASMAARLQPGSMVHARGWGSRGPQGSALEATAMGDSADHMQALFAGPGMTPPPPGRPSPGAPRPMPPAPL